MPSKNIHVKSFITQSEFDYKKHRHTYKADTVYLTFCILYTIYTYLINRYKYLYFVM